MKKKFVLLAMMIVLGVMGTNSAAYMDLEIRGMGSSVYGNYKLIYDTVLDITWYDFSRGIYNWDNQMAWAEGLSVSFGGHTFDEWRLPSAGESPCYGEDCTSSEMGHLYYVSLGNPSGGGTITSGPFDHIFTIKQHWFSTEYEPVDWAYRFNFIQGFQGYDPKSSTLYALAVRDGDVGAFPEPDFSATPLSGTAPLTVNFTDESSGIIDTWEWDFGDNSALSNNQNPQHTYQDPGTYTVELTVTGPGGTDTETKADYIVVEHETPVANFTADNTIGDAPLTVNFSDESTDDITSCLWDFGDGETSTEQNPNHTYDNPGIYTVSLSVSGPHGSDTEVKLGYITVSEPDDDDGGGGGGCFISTPLLGIFPISQHRED